MRTEVRSFTNEEIDKLLEAGGNYRKFREVRARKWLAEMEAGRWEQPHPQGIVLGKGGRVVLDGQHRLWAAREYCRRTGRKITFLVIEVDGAKRSEAVSMTSDTGDKRTITDYLNHIGVENATTTASALQIASRIRKENLIGSAFDNVKGVSISEMAAVFEADKNRFVEAAQIAVSACARMKAGSPGLLAGVAYLIAKKNRNGCRTFFARLGDGAGLESDNPILKLRGYWQGQKSIGTRRAVIRRAVHAAVTIKAWNAWANGERPKLLKWATNGDTPDQFPQIEKGDSMLFAEVS